jgi:AAA+ superfamily predicted ATPase
LEVKRDGLFVLHSGEGEEGEEGEDGEDGEGAEEGEEEDGSEGQEGRRGRRYALRQRTEVQRFSPRRKEQPARLSPQVAANGRNRKRGREGRQRPSSRSGKRRHTLRADDSDNSLLLDEVERGWGGSRIPDGLYVPPGELSAPPAFAPPATGWANQDPGAAEPVAAGGASAKAGADIQPVAVDLSVDFDQVGGLSNYVDALKEMVFFPLLYPDFFANYHITPPRGVLLCGPPGTGKTLVARALAAAASKAGQKVTFYMRKGADVLSKWVGEAERQLKMLFEEAQRNQPAIIFFDEIDGLAPVRSSKQEQIHNSIVSTLLALMDGLDSRGQVVVIGATNRVDAIDSALRRPGRFDREFTFPLPNADARAEILNIHTRNWAKPPSTPLIEELASTCVGYCGADLKALCTEAAIRAFRHKYPQVYQSDEQYVIDIDSVVVERRHFVEAMAAITPAAHRYGKANNGSDHEAR